MKRAAPTRAVRDLTGMLHHAGYVLTTRLSAGLGEIGLTPRLQCVLIHAMEQERTQIQLAELADLDKTTMVVAVDELEKAGWAERRPSSTDRRARIIAVTEAGARVATAGQLVVDRVHEEVLAALPKGKADAFVDALSRLVEGALSAPLEGDHRVRRVRQRR